MSVLYCTHEASFLLSLSSGPFLLSLNDFHYMSQSPPEPEAARSSKYEAIFDEALKAYEKKTRKDLKSDPLLRTLEACKSPDEALTELQRQIPGFDQSENGDNKLTSWVDPVVNVLYLFAQTIGGAVGLVSLGRFIVIHLRSAS